MSFIKLKMRRHMEGKELTQKVQKMLAAGKQEQVLELLQDLISTDPSFVDAWMLLGALYRAKGELDKAIEVCKQASKELSESPLVWNNLGQLYLEKKRYDQALEAIEKGLALDPMNWSGWYSLGQLYTEKKDVPHAINAYKKAVEIDPARFDGWRMLASALDDDRQYIESIKAYKKALELRPEDFVSMVGMGMAYMNAGEFKDAVTVYHDCLKINPKMVALWFHYGKSLSESGKLDQAIEAIEEGLTLDPTIAQAWIDLYKVYKKKGDEEKARWAMRKALDTGKVDIEFARDNEEVQTIINEWNKEQAEKKNESDSLIERRIFPSWSLKVPANYNFLKDEPRIQLNSPDGTRSITASTLTFNAQDPTEIAASVGNNLEKNGMKKRIKITRKEYYGFVFENVQFTHMGTYVLYCIIASSTSALMLTFSLDNTKQNKDWAISVIDSLRFHKS